MMLTILATRLENYKLVNVPVYRYRNQFGPSAISNKLSWKYWADYMQYFKENVLSKVEDGWPDVYDASNVIGRYATETIHHAEEITPAIEYGKFLQKIGIFSAPLAHIHHIEANFKAALYRTTSTLYRSTSD